MRGAIVGDIVGSIYQGAMSMNEDFPLFASDCRFTDDTVLTIAIAEAIQNNTGYAASLRQWGRRYPRAEYGLNFGMWLLRDGAGPYNSFGNGSAMRVSPVGWAFSELSAVLVEARKTAEVTHNHPEGIKGAQAIAAAIFVARMGYSKPQIKNMMEHIFNYDCSETIDAIRRRSQFDITCQGTVPMATIAFLQSHSFEHAIRVAVSFGGDTDTLACITGAIAEAFYGGVPPQIWEQTRTFLDAKLTNIIDTFTDHFHIPYLSDNMSAS